MEAKQVENLLKNIRGAYQHRFIDKDLVITVGHNAPHLKSWGPLDSSLCFFDSPRDFYKKIDKFLNFFVSPIVVYDKEDQEKFFSFQTNFPHKQYPIVKNYLLAVLESLPIFLGSEQTEVEWREDKIKIHYMREQTLPLPLENVTTKPLFQKTVGQEELISHFKAREVLDSRGCPALEVDVILQGGLTARAIIPSGASTGRFEAKELRDADPSYFFSKGLKQACQNVRRLSSLFKGQNVQAQLEIDKKLLEQDPSPLKETLGANSLLGISLGCLRASAKSANKPLYEHTAFDKSSFYLPVPLMNVINGGLHGNKALNLQEFMIVPFDFSSFKEALRAGCEIFHHLKEELKKEATLSL